MINSRAALASLLSLLLSSPVLAGNTSKGVPSLGLAPLNGPTVKIEGFAPLSVEGLAPKLQTPGLAVPNLAIPQLPAALPSAAPALLQAPIIVDAKSVESLAINPAAPANVGALAQQMVGVEKALQSDHSGIQAGEGLDTIYFGGRNRGNRGGAVSGGGQGRRSDPSKSAVFIINDEGVEINGRAADYYTESKRLEAKYQGKVDMSESLGVMDDSYADVFAKLKTIESVARSRQITDENTHLEETLLFVDGVLRDGRSTIAVNTHRVYFHKAPDGPGKAESETKEGIRRVNGYLEEMSEYFARGGKAEAALGPLNEVVLGFDSRGYPAIKDHLKGKQAEFAAKIGKPVKFVFLDELTDVPTDKKAMREELNRLVRKYKGEGLAKIIEGVIYSRYVGLLLELKTIEHYYERGYKILQGGRELFDKNGQYITELDVVVQAPTGEIIVVEAKSARVSIPLDQALSDKVTYKLDTYIKHIDDMERAIGGKMAKVVFSFDVGNNWELAEYLEGKEEWLSKRYGRPVEFIFLDSSPEAQMATEEDGTRAVDSQRSAELKREQAKAMAAERAANAAVGRKHGKNKRRR